MSLVSDLIPQNLIQEKEKFFANNNYNPQFVYSREFSQSELDKYGTTTDDILETAQQIVDEAYHDTVDSELYAHRGDFLSQAQVTQKIEKFLDMHHLLDRYQLIWSSSFVTRTSITPNQIRLRLPPRFSKIGLLGMLYHEIGTHALRRINYEQQPWFKKKKKYGFGDYLTTEEGIASIHTLMPQTNSLAFSPALKYLTVDVAQQSSFVETWNFLSKYIDDPDKRWLITYRQKRGITDTSQPGGFTKDSCYFAGIVSVYNWLATNNYDPTKLYYGKLALEDIPKAVELNPDYEPILPSFWLVEPQEYAENIHQIGQANYLSK